MIDIGERAVLSVLVQRGGKLPERKDWIERSICGETGIESMRRYKVRQFNSRTIDDLARRGYARRRRIFVEITDAGRKALAAWRDPCQF